MTEQATPERWLPVVGHEGLYEVSDLGRVRSLPRRTTAGRIMRPGLAGPYLRVQLHKDGAPTSLRVHRLVAEAFLGPLPPGQHTRHGPGGRLDNRLANLTYGTPAQNIGDQARDGTRRTGTAVPVAKLSEQAVADCRRRHAAGESGHRLAAEHGVSQPTMARAISGQTWRHVPPGQLMP